MPEVHFEAVTVTAFQPPPPSPTYSVNPDHSAFGTTTLHAENRTTDPPYGRRLDWRERILVSACRQEVFIGDPNHVAGAATATRARRRNDKPIRPAPPACVVPLELDHFLYLCTHTPPRLPQPRQRGLRLLPQWFRHTRFTSCAHPSLLSHNTMVQTGRHPKELCLRVLVRYIYMRFPPTPAKFRTPTHAPTAPPPTSRATTALLLRLPATSSRLSAAAAIVKSPSAPQPWWA